MGFQLRDTLRRLCEEIGWKYAVLWRATGDMHLVWEDGYWDHGSTSSEVEFLVNKIMLPQVHVFGDKLVGEAASSGNHFWILRDTFNVFGLGSKDLLQLNHQFLAGIQTIAVIPVLPFGVLQLGSSQMVMENIGFVNCVTNCFGELGCAGAVVPGIVETTRAESIRVNSGVSPILTKMQVDNVGAIKPVPPEGSDNPSIYSIADTIFNQRYDLKASQGMSMYPQEGYSSDSSQSVLTAGKQKQDNCSVEDCYVPFTEFDTNDPYSRSVSSTKDSKFVVSDCPHETRTRITMGPDLYDVLGSDYNHSPIHIGNESVGAAQLDACSLSYSSMNGTPGPGLQSGHDTDQLLDAIISKINFGAKQKSDDNLFYKPLESKIGDTSPPVPDVSPDYKLVALAKQLQGELFEGHRLGNSDAACSSSVISSSSLGNIAEGLPNTGINMCDKLSDMHSKRVDGNNKMNKKRSKPGENPRPRPKDRQMIMDRVKELREIIPNGAKLSIDALLEKTIKHMLFLQSVTKHAEKLKDIGERKFIDRDGGLHLNDNLRSGATWAYEVGSQHMLDSQAMTCPIIVEDLNPPRQLLVEMLCEQRGSFLEIAEFVRGLGLTILKGAMEVRKDKIWAHFAVEADRDVTRVEIFLSLVRLLEPSSKSSTAPQDLDKISSLHNMYNRSCIPASGPSDHLR